MPTPEEEAQAQQDALLAIYGATPQDRERIGFPNFGYPGQPGYERQAEPAPPQPPVPSLATDWAGLSGRLAPRLDRAKPDSAAAAGRCDPACTCACASTGTASRSSRNRAGNQSRSCLGSLCQLRRYIRRLRLDSLILGWCWTRE